MLMLSALLSAAIHSSNPQLPPKEVARYTSWVIEEAREHSLDPWVFHAIIHRETHWTATAVRHERDGSCSVGLGQINTRCNSSDIKVLLNPRNNLSRMGYFLARIRRMCRKGCAELGWLRRYNPGDADYLHAVQAAVRSCHEHTESAVSRVRPDLRPSGVRVHSTD